MFQGAQYHIKDSDKFNATDYPRMTDELATMRKEMIAIPIYHKENIVISYLKNHCIESDWIKANPELSRLMTSNTFQTAHIESLFESCRGNKVFLKHFEDYIKKQFN